VGKDVDDIFNLPEKAQDHEESNENLLG